MIVAPKPATSDPEQVALSPTILEEIAEFERRADAFRRGDEEEESFKPYRLSYGIYGQRQPGYQMVRVKIPHGRLTSNQLEALAEFSERFCDEGEYPGGGGAGMGHITTRQDMQFHFVKLERVPEAMRHLAEAGLTTREACYNTVRNITGCPLAGACGTEAFDITPYAQAATELFLRNAFCQNLPRKFKISFSGCESDCGLGAMHDIGAVARVVDNQRGFRLWVGGGLGNSPRAATLLYDFIAVTDFYATLEAIVRIFDAEGPRKNRNRARLKFLFDKTYDAGSFRARVEEIRASLPTDARCFSISAELPQRVDREATRRAELTSRAPVSLDEMRRGVAYARWKATNVMEHREPGYGIVTVRLTLGDITSDRLRVVAGAARRFSGGEARATVGQNLVLRDVRREDLAALHDFLAPHGLADAEAKGIRDIVTCPGADTCNLGITSSRGLGRAVTRWIDENRYGDLPELSGATIKASGCPNSCGQHHVATVGFYGNSKHVGEEPVPHYMMMLGGAIDAKGARMAQAVMKIPARRVPAALDRLMTQYRDERARGELFAQWIERADRESVKQHLADLALSDMPDRDEVIDWDQDTAFTGKTGEGECAAV
jgi:sulfite reductase (ferredoxin)